jgi:long-chain acyl-CoA synthetase
VVAKDVHGRTQVHAVLVLKRELQQEEIDRIIGNANAQLENFQRIRSYSLWPGTELPRTPTGKLKRLPIAQGIVTANEPDNKTDRVLAELFSGSNRSMDQDLGLSSLDRVELLVELERRTGTPIDESSFAAARSVSDIAKLLDEPSAKVSEKHISFHAWAQSLPVEWFRSAVRNMLVFPAMHRRVKVNVAGTDNLLPLRLPVMFVANHQSILDVPVILKALPRRFRSSLAPAMGTGRAAIDMLAASLFFNTYPLPRTSIGLRQAIEYTADLADRGYSPLVFPEGERTPHGRLTPFRPGIGIIVREVRLPVVPIYIQGAFEIWPIHARGPRKNMPPVQVQFGNPIDFTGKAPAEITTELETWFQAQEGNRK